MINLEKLKTYSIYFTLIIMNLGVVLKAYGLDLFRYLIYFPAVLGLFFLFLNKFKLDSFSLKYNPVSIAFFLLIVNGLLHLPIIDAVGYSQLFFILAGLLPIFIFRRLRVHWRYVSIIYIVGYLLAIGGNEFAIDFSLERFFTSDISSAETNQHPFVFGVLTLFFLYNRDKKFFLLNLIFVVLSFKRIVFLGVLAAIPFVLIERQSRIIMKNKRWLFLVANIMVLFIIISFTEGLYDDLIKDITGLSAGHFTMGRNTLYEPLVNKFFEMNFLEKIFGLGQAFTYNLSISYIGDAPHNDLLVLLIDQGVIVFCLFFLWIYKVRVIYPIIFSNVLFITDNTLIYTFYTFIFFLLVNNLNTPYENPDRT